MSGGAFPVEQLTDGALDLGCREGRAVGGGLPHEGLNQRWGDGAVVDQVTLHAWELAGAHKKVEYLCRFLRTQGNSRMRGHAPERLQTRTMPTTD